jgi:hypothetical protein
VQWAPGIPHALQGGERFFNGSGAWRGEIVRVCLQTMRLFENEFGVGTERGAAIAPQTASVMPGLDPGIHQSSQQVFQRGWITGASPVMTILMGTTVCCGAATRPSQLEERRRARPVVVETRRVARSSIRSVNLTIFWHCGHRYFSFRTAWERLPGNEPSMVLAEDARPKGSGNADSQPNVRSSGESGQCRSSRCCSGCVLAHPASWRASASYRPLRAVWADCAWALRGCARSKVPSALQAART